MQRGIAINRFSIVFILSILVCSLATNAQALKGLYVNDFYSIIGNQTKENALLSYAHSNNFNYLILYNTSKIHRQKYPLDSKMGSKVWAEFIKKAKTEFAIKKIGVVGEKAASFIPANIYNRLVEEDILKRIDVFNLEFEFWNKQLYNSGGYYCKTYLLRQGYDCTNAGAFDFYIKQLKEMQKLKGESDVEIETYIGNPTDEQLATIAKVTDRILIHYYRKNIDRIAFYKLNRLLTIQRTNPDLKIAPIFSSRENHSGPWLKTHKIDELTPLFFYQLKSAPGIDLKSLNFDGIIWYRYSDMPKN